MQTTRFLVVIGAVAAVWAHPIPSFAASDSEVQAKMREALRQQMEALDTQAAPAPAPAAKSAPAPAVAAAPTVVVPVPVEAAATAAKSDSVFSEVPVDDSNAAAAKQREALRQALAAEPAVAAPAKPGVPVFAPVPAPTTTSVVASQPLTEPAIAPAFSGSKQNRLAALLQQYKADQITPQQYHTQRAAIIAEP